MCGYNLTEIDWKSCWCFTWKLSTSVWCRRKSLLMRSHINLYCCLCLKDDSKAWQDMREIKISPISEVINVPIQNHPFYCSYWCIDWQATTIRLISGLIGSFHYLILFPFRELQWSSALSAISQTYEWKEVTVSPSVNEDQNQRQLALVEEYSP